MFGPMFEPSGIKLVNVVRQLYYDEAELISISLSCRTDLITSRAPTAVALWRRCCNWDDLAHRLCPSYNSTLLSSLFSSSQAMIHPSLTPSIQKMQPISSQLHSLPRLRRFIGRYCSRQQRCIPTACKHGHAWLKSCSWRDHWRATSHSSRSSITSATFAKPLATTTRVRDNIKHPIMLQHYTASPLNSSYKIKNSTYARGQNVHCKRLCNGFVSKKPTSSTLKPPMCLASGIKARHESKPSHCRRIEADIVVSTLEIFMTAASSPLKQQDAKWNFTMTK